MSARVFFFISFKKLGHGFWIVSASASKLGKVLVTGLGLPSEMIDYVKNGSSTKFAIWNPVDLGYFNAYVSHHVAQGNLTGKKGEKFSAGRMGDYTVEVDGEVTFGNIFRFDASNIDEGAKLF